MDRLVALEGALVLVGKELDSFDRSQARLASKALARAIGASIARLTVSLPAFHRGMPSSSVKSLQAAAPAATEAVLYFKREQDLDERTVPMLFKSLALKPKLRSLRIIEYTVSLSPHSWEDEEEAEAYAWAQVAQTAGYWAPHLHILAAKLTSLCVQPLTPLLLVHERCLSHMTALQQLELHYGDIHSSKTKRMPALAATLHVLTMLPGLVSLQLVAKARDDEDSSAVAAALEELARSCSNMTRLHLEGFKVQGSAPLLLPQLEELHWPSPLILPHQTDAGQASTARTAAGVQHGGALNRLTCLVLRNMPAAAWAPLLALPCLAGTLVSLDIDKCNVPVELLQKQAPAGRGSLLGLAALRSLNVQVEDTAAVRGIALLTHLQALKLSVRPTYGTENLRQVDLVPLGALQRLTSLDISASNIDGATMTALAALSQLLDLHLYGFSQSWDPDYRLPGMLRSFDLTIVPSNPFSDERGTQVELLAVALPTSLTSLRLGGIGCHLHLKGTQPLPRLHKLTLQIDSFDPAWLQGCKALRSLDIMPPRATDLDLARVFRLVPQLTQLKIVEGMPMFTGTDIVDAGPSFKNLGAISLLTDLRSLVHCAASFGSTLPLDELTALGHLTQLTFLDFYSDIDAEHWADAAFTFSRLMALQVLKLHCNGGQQHFVPSDFVAHMEELTARVEVLSPD